MQNKTQIRLEGSLKESQMENQTSMKEMQKEMQIRLEGILKEMQIIKTEEFRNSRVENQINIERLENNMMCQEERLEYKLKNHAQNPVE